MQSVTLVTAAADRVPPDVLPVCYINNNCSATKSTYILSMAVVYYEFTDLFMLELFLSSIDLVPIYSGPKGSRVGVKSCLLSDHLHYDPSSRET